MECPVCYHKNKEGDLSCIYCDTSLHRKESTMQGIIIIRIGKLTGAVTYYNRDDILYPWSYDTDDATIFTEQDMIPKYEDNNFFRYDYISIERE
jgi:hypothetical protein